MNKVSKRIFRFDYILFFVFLLSISLDPSSGFIPLKEPLFCVLMLLGLLFVLNRKPHFYNESVLVIGTLFFISIYGYSITILRQTEYDSSFVQAYFKAILFVLIVVYLYSVDFKYLQKVIWINGIIMALVTLSLYVIFYLNEDYYLQIFAVTQDNNFVLLGKREFLGIELNGVTLRASPLMFFALLYTFYYYESRWKKVFILLLMVAFLVSGSRTPPLIAITIFLIYLKDKGHSRILNRALVSGLFLALIIIVYKLASETGETSNEIKYSNVSAYFADITDGCNFIFGSGIGSYFYAPGDQLMLSFTELTYLDIYRMFGFFIGTLFIVVILYLPFHKVFFSKIEKPMRRYALGYLFYMILAGTNPFLFNSTGMFVLAIGLRMINETHKELSNDKRVPLNI